MRLLCLMALFLVFPVTVFAESKAELVEKLTKLDGSDLQLNTLRDQMVSGVAPYQKTLSPSDFALLRKSTEKNFDGGRLAENYKKVLATQITEDALRQAIEWFESPLARKFSGMQARLATSDGVKELTKFAASYKKGSVPPARDKLLRDLDSALKATDLFVDLTVNITSGITAGVMSIRGTATDDELTKARAQLASLRKQVRPRIARSTYLNNLFMFREATDDELREYTKFFRTPVGHAVIEASFFALNDALEHAAEEVGREIGLLRKAKAEAQRRD